MCSPNARPTAGQCRDSPSPKRLSGLIWKVRPDLRALPTPNLRASGLPSLSHFESAGRFTGRVEEGGRWEVMPAPTPRTQNAEPRAPAGPARPACCRPRPVDVTLAPRAPPAPETAPLAVLPGGLLLSQPSSPPNSRNSFLAPAG